MNIYLDAQTEGVGFFAPMHTGSARTARHTLGRIALGLVLSAGLWHGQAWSAQPGSNKPVARHSAAAASQAELMYLVLVGEMQVAANQAGVGYALILDAAKKSGEADLFKRAVNLAIEARSLDGAKDAARAWSAAAPASTEPHKLLLQLMLASNDVENTAEPLKQLLSLANNNERSALIDTVVQTYIRANDKEAARRVVLTALQPWTLRQDTAASAWAATGVLSLAAGLKEPALEALFEALKSPAQTDAPGLLAVDLLGSGVSAAEDLLNKHLAAKPSVQVRMAYMRYLLDKDRATDARAQLEKATQQDPKAPEPWLLLGALNLQENRLDAAETGFLRYLEMAATLETDRAERGKTQAYLSMAQIAESRQQFDEAAHWLDRVDTDEDALRVQLRRATLLGRKGQVAEARALISQIPELKPSDARAKLATEVQLLKMANDLPQAYALLKAAVEKDPSDAELAYDLAMLADKMGNHVEMERILRDLMVRKPEYHHAYNALGYSLAELNTRIL